MEKQCEYCQSSFEAKRIDTVYCSQSCRQMAYMDRKFLLSGNESINSAITPKENKIEYPSISKPSTNILGNDTETQVKTTPIIKEPIENVNSAADLSVNNKAVQSVKTEKPDYEFTESKFLNALAELSSKRNYDVKLVTDWGKSPEVLWVCIRYKCIIDCLLTLSEAQFVMPDDLKEICNALTYITTNKRFNYLPHFFPYTKDMLYINKFLRELCKNLEDYVPVKFSLSQKKKIELIVSRSELSYIVPRVSFNQLTFEDQKNSNNNLKN